MKAMIKEIMDSLERNKNKILKWIFITLITLIGIILIAIIIDMLLVKVLGYADANPLGFLIIMALLYGIAWLVINKFKMNPHTVETPLMFNDGINEAMERTYVNIARGVICTLFSKLASVYPFLAPSMTSDVYSPSRARQKDNITYYEYAAVKKEEVDIVEVEGFLRSELTRMLFDKEAHELPSNTKFIDGVEHPILQINSVKDVGNHILVSIVVTTEKYQKLIAYRTRAKFETLDTKSGADDDEFI